MEGFVFGLLVGFEGWGWEQFACIYYIYVHAMSPLGRSMCDLLHLMEVVCICL